MSLGAAIPQPPEGWRHGSPAARPHQVNYREDDVEAVLAAEFPQARRALLTAIIGHHRAYSWPTVPRCNFWPTVLQLLADRFS